MSTQNCNACDFVSLEDRYTDEDYWWEYYCNLDTDKRKIELEEGEDAPTWCPRKTVNQSQVHKIAGVCYE